MIKRLWTDETAAIISADIIMVATTLVIGVMVGLKSVRDAVVTELADVAQAVANHDQSYSFSGVSGHLAASSGGFFLDSTDFCDTSAWQDGEAGEAGSKCVNVGDVVNTLDIHFDSDGNPTDEGGGITP